MIVIERNSPQELLRILADLTGKLSFLISNPITITSEYTGFRVIAIERNSPQELLKTLADLTGKLFCCF